jgi:hypothetical protein
MFPLGYPTEGRPAHRYASPVVHVSSEHGPIGAQFVLAGPTVFGPRHMADAASGIEASAASLIASGVSGEEASVPFVGAGSCTTTTRPG